MKPAIFSFLLRFSWLFSLALCIFGKIRSNVSHISGTGALYRNIKLHTDFVSFTLYAFAFNVMHLKILGGLGGIYLFFSCRPKQR